MGIVLKAHHVVLDRPVAIKVPLPRQLATQRDKDRFLLEARAAARLRHPNICPIYDVGEHEGVPYIAMGFIEGDTPQRRGPIHVPFQQRDPTGHGLDPVFGTGQGLRAWARQRKPTAHQASRARWKASLTQALQ